MTVDQIRSKMYECFTDPTWRSQLPVVISRELPPDVQHYPVIRSIIELLAVRMEYEIARDTTSHQL